MKIFPLSIPGKIVLILIAIAIGLIWSMLQFPEKWRWLFDRIKARNARKAQEENERIGRETVADMLPNSEKKGKKKRG